MSYRTGLPALAAISLLAAGVSARAAEFVTNGGFETTTLPISSEFGGQFPTQQVAGWHVAVGGQAYDAPTIFLPHHGFSGWRLATTSFIATSSTQVLSFLATGGPSFSQPPFALLDGVSLTTAVPEPATWAVIVLGF